MLAGPRAQCDRSKNDETILWIAPLLRWSRSLEWRVDKPRGQRWSGVTASHKQRLPRGHFRVLSSAGQVAPEVTAMLSHTHMCTLSVTSCMHTQIDIRDSHMHIIDLFSFVCVLHDVYLGLSKSVKRPSSKRQEKRKGTKRKKDEKSRKKLKSNPKSS